MFSVSHIRAQARQTINTVPGIYLLALIPVAITAVTNIFSYVYGQGTTVYSELATNPSATTGFVINSTLFPMFYGLLISFLYLSISWTLIQVVRKTRETVAIKDALFVFTHPHFVKILVTYLLKNFLLFLWSIPMLVGLFCFIVGLMLAIISYYLPPEGLVQLISAFLLGGFILLVAGCALYCPQYYAYSQVEFLLYDRLENNNYTSAFSLIRDSRQLMKGYKAKRWVLDLSFIGWFFLMGITFGLVGLYVVPYHYCSQVYFYEALKEEQALKVNYFF
ncbi:DUF975 family protein [Streptococcus oriscaviae]|uniref:DUF975 family protein n=1 Tax=Streptococcus oriscaviae TaxID=2781599 RepID=A0ABX7YKJ8_9STRE|nr:DUF975 family protein [Streptococcus oriscaviae]QUE54215.1 DUF975 family protein [Streptococcus oriscaviae]